jgi:CHAT domain-containing protein/tetratricopeptide (TPR) repeat protein
LIKALPAERAALLERDSALVGVALAYALKDRCYAAWNTDPAQAVEAAAALAAVSARSSELEVAALAAWASGVAALAEGQMEQAVAELDRAADRFAQLGQADNGARVQVPKLIALATLGRYDDAMACGLAARDVLLAHGDPIAAGRVESNLGTIAFRRDQYADAERYYRLAHTRLQAADEPAALARIEIGLADVLSLQHRLAEAESLYEQALRRAGDAELGVVQAIAECNLGDLALARGEYAQALSYLERSRRRYAALEMPHETAIADLQLAEAYLELNLAPEAATIFARVIPLFTELGMQFEHAWALAHAGQTALLLGEPAEARRRFAEARALFEAEENQVSAAMVALYEAQLRYQERQYVAAAAAAARAAKVFEDGGNTDRRLVAAWLEGEALRCAGDHAAAQPLLDATLRQAEAAGAPKIVQRCATSLGLLAASTGDRVAAEGLLTHALAVIEQMRAPLPGEEFRTAFLSDKLSPFDGLVRLALDDGRVADALGYVERARSRALSDMLGGAARGLARPRDAFEAGLYERLNALRQELNWCYQRISRTLEGEGTSAGGLQELQQAAQEREAAILELTRQIQQYGGGDRVADASLRLDELQAALADDTALVEYFSLDGELLVFVVTSEATRVVRKLAGESEVEELVERLRFQTDAMRRAVGREAAHVPILTARARHLLARLYDLLLRPIAPLIGERRVTVVPHRALHYVPFRALFDGERYLIERQEVCTVPSAAVLLHCLQQPPSPHQNALFLGVPDARAPRVRDEVLAVAPQWPERVALLDGEATLAALQRHAPTARIIHLACHGQFRADSPLFSSLQLADGWMTVRDAYNLELSCDLVVLSACETGVSAIAPGDELIGLARGFFAAGAPALLVSLWTVDDATTAELMTAFYGRLRAGERPAAALRAAQLVVMQHHPHPFYWAPFVLLGRW